MRRYRNWIFSALLAFLFFEIWVGFPILLEKKSTSNNDNSTTANLGEALKKMQGVHLVESRQGDQDWELFADAAEEKRVDKSWSLKTVKAIFYAKKNVEFEVYGQSGFIDGKTRDISITGNVLTKTSNGYQFKSQDVKFISKQRILESQSRVSVVGPSTKNEKPLAMKAQKMKASIDDGLIRLIGQVETEKGLSNDKTLFIKSDQSTISSRQKVVGFSGTVSMQVDLMKIESPEINLVYRDDQDLLQSILFSGGVKMSDRDKIATAEQVRFDPTENKFILSGKPKVMQGLDEIVGDQIVFIDGGKKVKIENVKGRSEKK
jgi:LPS export ABC transporter protein LptC/lipopolysaccharide transport protein LptA